MRYFTIFLALSGLFLSSCKNKTDMDNTDMEKTDMDKIEDYLSDNNLTAESTASGLYYIITQEGIGDHPTLQSTVTVKYKGYLLDGTVFDQTLGASTATFKLAELIQGWQEAVPLLKKNGKGTFFCPSNLGYGPYSQGNIPPNSVLIFEIELVNF